MAQYAHKGEILPLINQMIPINQETTFHASYDHGLHGFNQGEIVEPVGPTNSLVFDGSTTYIDCGKNPIFDLIDSGEIQVWVKSYRAYPSDDTGIKYRNIVSKSIGGTIGQTAYCIEWVGTNTERTLRGSIRTETEGINISVPDFNFGTEWRHLRFGWSGSTIYLYIDGELYQRKTQTSRPLITHPTASLRIGDGYSGSANYRWDGEISDVKISSGNKLIGHWKFAEKEGSIAYDTSGNMNDGIIKGTFTRKAGPTIATKEGKFGGAVLIEPETTNLWANQASGNPFNIYNNFSQPATLVATGEYYLGCLLYTSPSPRD